MAEAQPRRVRFSASTLISLAAWTLTRTAQTTPAATTNALSTAEVEQRLPPLAHPVVIVPRLLAGTPKPNDLPTGPPTIPLGLNSHHPLHSFFAGHGFSVPISSGAFDREQAETEWYSNERYTSGSAKEQSATDSGQILKRPSVPYQKKG